VFSNKEPGVLTAEARAQLLAAFNSTSATISDCSMDSTFASYLGTDGTI
jgi:hypothetical protein